MSKLVVLKDDDLFDNPSARVPVCLCLDVSDSMNAVIGRPSTGYTNKVFRDGKWYGVSADDSAVSRLDKLQEGLKEFYDTIKNDDDARFSAEISVVTFSDRAELLLDFATVDRFDTLPQLTASGETSMGDGINLALDKLLARKEHYKKVGIGYYQPWLVLMTDGEANLNYPELVRAENRIKELVEESKLTVFPIGIGPDADFNLLNRLSPKRPAVRLKAFKFKELFEWLSKSVSTVVKTLQPGDSVDDIIKLGGTVKSFAEPL